MTEAQKKRFEKLNQGETRMEHFAIRVTDEHGNTASNIIHLDLTITGANDRPTIDIIVSTDDQAASTIRATEP